MLLLSLGLGLSTGCATWNTPASPLDTVPPPATVEADDIGALMRFANRIRTLPDANRKALVHEWESRAAASGISDDSALHLAVVLYHSDQLIPDALTRAATLLNTYLANGDDHPPALIAFARWQLGLVEDKARWRAALDQQRQTRSALQQERRARQELEKKLEALTAIERRMTDKDSNDKVPLR